MTDTPERIFIVWFGPEMNRVRHEGLKSIEAKSEIRIEFIQESNLDDWILPSSPLHPSFQFLTAIQKSDYLRCYLMHHHGGGYTDIKPCSSSWRPSMELLNRKSDAFGIGYPEIGRHGVARLGLNLTKRLELRPLEGNWWKYRWLQVNYRRLIGNGAFIFRPDTRFTQEWFSLLNQKMDFYSQALKRNPGRHPKERPGETYDFGVSSYPIPWADLMANIFHPLCLKYYKHLLRSLPTPEFDDYQ